MAHLRVIRGAARPASASASASTDDAEQAEWLRLIATGDRESLALLYRAYHRRLARFLARLTRRADIVDEAINDVFWVVWQHAERFRGDARVSTWVMGIAYRCALKALRTHGVRELAATEDGRDDDGQTPGAFADPFALHELNDWVDKALARLTPDQRVAIELAYGAGHSLEEIAVIMDCPVSTVKARMFHARVKLRRLLPELAGSAGSGEGERADE